MSVINPEVVCHYLLSGPHLALQHHCSLASTSF